MLRISKGDWEEDNPSSFNKGEKMQINKFKIKDGDILIEYSVDKKDSEGKLISTDFHTIKSPDKPLASLEKALDNLAGYVKEICEEKENADIQVTGVSFSWNFNGDGDTVMGAVIIAKKKLKRSTGVLNLITPHRITDYYSEHGDEGQLMPDGMETDLQLLIVEVENYINGERLYKQEELFPKEENK